MKKVLLVINNDAFARIMVRWAYVLKRQGEWEPIIYISAGFMERHVVGCREDGIIILSAEPILNERTAKHFVQAKPGRMTKAIRMLLFPFRVFSNIIDITKQLRFIRNLIRQHGISVLMIAESSPVYGATIFMEAAFRERIPVFTSPVEKTNAQHTAESYLYDPHLSLKRPINRLIGFFYPQWAITHKGFQMLRVLPGQILALEWLRLPTARPWEVVGYQGDIVAVDSQSTFDNLKSQGVLPERMAVVGRPEHDIMTQSLQDPRSIREKLYKRLGLPANRPMLLSNLVPDHYVSGRPECDFQEYAKMVEFWVKSLGAVNNHNVIINLHPGHTYGQDAHAWDFLEQWGVKICRDDLASLVPLCDIYVVAGYSSTALWAMACGKPMIIYDVYRYNIPIYRSFPGVIEVQEQKDFIYTLKQLSTDTDYYSGIKKKQEDIAEYWGKLDGKAGKRLTDLFERTIS